LESKSLSTLELSAAIYLLAGLLFVFVGPAAKGLRLELSDLTDHPNRTLAKVAGFAICTALSIILLWPVLVPSAWRTYGPPTSLEAVAYIVERGFAEADKRRPLR
jgi:hypothetical protein